MGTLDSKLWHDNLLSKNEYIDKTGGEKYTKTKATRKYNKTVRAFIIRIL